MPSGNKPLPEPMLTQIYGVTRPQWVKSCTKPSIGYFFFSRVLSIRSGPETGLHVSVQKSPHPRPEDDGLVSDPKWAQLGGPFEKVHLDMITGHNIMRKIEILMACLAKEPTPKTTWGCSHPPWPRYLHFCCQKILNCLFDVMSVDCNKSELCVCLIC